MLVGCYTMHLYCDLKECKHAVGDEPYVYTADTMTQCIKQAVKDGWRINRGSGTFRESKHYCPAHRKITDRRDYYSWRDL